MLTALICEGSTFSTVWCILESDAELRRRPIFREVLSDEKRRSPGYELHRSDSIKGSTGHANKNSFGFRCYYTGRIRDIGAGTQARRAGHNCLAGG